MTSTVSLTDKERARSWNGVVVIVRPQADGGYMVASVNAQTGVLLLKPAFVDARDKIASAVAEEMRFLSKCGIGHPATTASRRRNRKE